jgi:hypothetical protein
MEESKSSIMRHGSEKHVGSTSSVEQSLLKGIRYNIQTTDWSAEAYHMDITIFMTRCSKEALDGGCRIHQAAALSLLCSSKAVR